MSMALRTQMQIKCCCAAYPPNYQCDCADLSDQFTLGQITQPRTITIDVNLTNGTCDYYNTAGGNSCEGVDANCTDCIAHCGGCGYPCPCPTYNDDPGCDNLSSTPPMRSNPVGTANHHYIVAKNVDEPLSTNCKPEGFTDSKTGLCYGEWNLHHAGELWYWAGAGWLSFCPDSDHIGCGAGSDTGRKAEFVNSPIASVVDGNTYLRLNNEMPFMHNIKYVPDEDYYGDWYYELGGNSDSLEWGSAPKVPYFIAQNASQSGYEREFYIWNDGSTDISAVFIWHKPPSGWACGDATPQYADALIIDVIGGADEGRYEITCGSGNTIKDLDVFLGNINSALTVLCVGTLRTTRLDKFRFGTQVSHSWNYQNINNRGCTYDANGEQCFGQPPEFPPNGCGYQYDPYVIQGAQTNDYVASSYLGRYRRNGLSIGYSDAARVRGIPGDDGSPMHKNGLVGKSDTSGTTKFGSDLQFNWCPNHIAIYNVELSCFDSSEGTDPPDELNTNGRGWQVKFKVSNVLCIDNKPIGYNCYGVYGYTEAFMWYTVPRADLMWQRFMISTENQGECGLSLLENNYTDWHGNRMPDSYSKGRSINEPPWTCVSEDLPRPELGVYSASNLCNYVDSPGVHVDIDHCDGKTCKSNPVLHFHAQLAGIEVTESFDYPALSCVQGICR